jgi:hypothetical protein
MCAVKLKTSKAASPKKPAAVKKGTVTKTAVSTKAAKPKATGIIILKAKMVKAPLAKKEYVEPVRRGLSRSAMPVEKQHALSVEDLKKRQESKGTTRKQGGVKYETLTVEELKTMANILESGPTEVD